MADGESQESASGLQRLHPIDAVHFVHHAIKHAIRDDTLKHGDEITAAGLCKILLELAVDEFGGEGKGILIGWKIETSADVGLITQRLRDAEVTEAFAVPLTADFSDLFDLHQAPDSWAIKW